MMQKFFINLFILLMSLVLGYGSCAYLSGKYLYMGIFFAGIIFGIFLMMLKLNSKNDKIISYKRELEKESISSDEAEAKVKVLESKIKVLEKALENALNK